MWSDTLLAAERAQLLRVGAWGAASLLAGTLVLAWLALRRAHSSLLQHFAVQTAVWGLAVLAAASLLRRSSALRDFAGAVRLEHAVVLGAGLATGVVAAGTVLALAGWALGRRAGALGAGVGVATQGLALLLLDLHFYAFLARSLAGTHG